MVQLTRIYTRGGDEGQTSLGSGQRVPKDDLRVAAFGTIDEANSVIGIARLHTGRDSAADAILARIQNDLFDLGADLCNPQDQQRKSTALRIVPAQTIRLEQEIDALNEALTPLQSFVLPGGSPASAHLHLARTVVRRGERLICELAKTEQINPNALQYTNRLSDLLFVLARHLNDGGKADILWQPGENSE